MVEVYKCIICKKPYLGDEKPSHCPYCGVYSRYLVLAKEHIHDVSYIDTPTKKHLLQVMEIKIDNIKFYRDLEKKIKDSTLKTMLEALEKIDNRHLKILIDLGLPRLEEKRGKVKIYSYIEDNIAEMYHRKNNVIKKVKEVNLDIEDPFIKEILLALSDVEKDHIKMIEDMIEK